MPGIVGLITRMPRPWAESHLLRMVEALGHESFYTTGTWIDEGTGVYVGCVAQENSFSDGMPLSNERGDVSLVFSGEEFPDSESIRRLQQGGHRIETSGPSYLVHIYEEDPTFPSRLNGRFHGLLADRARGTTTLFNDRYGMHRLYYHQAKEAFYFAAEAKAILAVRPELRTVNVRSLGEYVACGCVLENRTLFEHIQVLPPAAAWVFRNGSLERKASYFEAGEWENQQQLEPEDYYQELHEVFTRNLPRYFNGRQRIGMSLTGGLDTRMILACHQSPPASLPCYTFGGMFRDCQDVIVARKVANACRQPHEVILVGEDFLSRFAHYAERTVYLTDGCCDVSHSTDLYVNERARNIAPVRLTGNYGGEVLRRVRAFKPVEPAPGLFRPEFLSHVHRTRETYAALLREHPLSFAVFRQAPWHHYGLLALEQTQLSLRSPYLDNDLVRTVFRAPDSAVSNDELCLRLISDGNSGLWRIPTDRAIGGDSWKWSATALQAYRTFTIKAEYAYDYGMPQWVARVDNLFALLHFERLFLGRNKFYHFRVWYRDVLSNYVREMLLDSRSLGRSYLEPKQMEAMVCAHLKGNRNYTSEIHALLTLELVHRLFLDAT